MSTIEAPAPTTTVTTADLLNRAADILEEFEWRQGSTGSRADESMCAVGAIVEASYDLAVTIEVYHAALCSRGTPRECETFPLARWNDVPGRTKAEVVAELRRLAR